jgi:hypothetical protein
VQNLRSPRIRARLVRGRGNEYGARAMQACTAVATTQSMALRREVLLPSPPSRRGLIGAIVGCHLLLVAAIGAWTANHVRRPAFANSQVASTQASTGVDDLLFVFRAGGATYVRLADLRSDEVPTDGAQRFVEDDDGTAVIAAIDEGEVPIRYRRYRRARLRVDRECDATVRGFAIVARLVGDPGYAGLLDANWTARSVVQHGATMLAARIDGCATGTYARVATSSNFVSLDELVDRERADRARSALVASPAAADAQVAWQSAGLHGNWYDQLDIDAKVLRHPGTGTTWVTVHATYPEIDCAGPDVNLWGLFVVSRDGGLEPVTIRKLETVYSIEAVIDADGDGDLELVGRSRLGLETILVDAADERELDRLRFPLYACPC